MSYVIQVWESPLPATLEEADDILGRLLDEKAGKPSSKLDALVKTLWERYPRDLENDKVDPVWEDTFSKSGREATPVETLAVATPYLDEVVPFVAKTAVSLGLVAYDVQYGTVYLPDGRMLGIKPPARTSPSVAGKERQPFGEKAAAKQFVVEMKPFMDTHGFAWTKRVQGDAFVRNLPAAAHMLAPVISSEGGSAGMDLVILAHVHALDEPLRRFKKVRGEDAMPVLSASLCAHFLGTKDPRLAMFDKMPRISLTSPDRVAAVCTELRGIVSTDILPGLQRIDTVEAVWSLALEELAGTQPAAFEVSLEAKALAGGLAGDSRLDKYMGLAVAKHADRIAKRRDQAASAEQLRTINQRDEEGRAYLSKLGQFARSLA
jgi:hypothetical protein